MARTEDQTEGRFCEQEVWLDQAHYGRCGGELRHARRVEGELIVTYLTCMFCGALTRLLEYDMQTGQHRDGRGKEGSGDEPDRDPALPV